MPYNIFRIFILILCMAALGACSSWQPTKNVWKSTKGLWNTYVSPPASVDYEDKGSLSPEAASLTRAIVGIDTELEKLERTMQNADRPPTQEWLTGLFAQFPWLNGFAGVKYDGTILGQEPAESIKQLDFIPLLYEDKKQHSHAIRGDIQPSPLGPEIMLAAPLYDGTDFLGIVVAYFDMRSLMHFSSTAADIVVLSPNALLWPGKYEYAATPLAGVDWAKVVRESTAGVCKNSTGSFYYVVRYLGNLPIIFAIPVQGTFPEGNGDLAQAAAYFPQEREKLPPPELPERKSKSDAGIPAFEKPEEPEPPQPPAPAQPMPEASERHVIPQGSKDSMLLKRGKARQPRRVQERQLDGDNVPFRGAPERSEPPVQLMPEQEGTRLPGGRPSPFGPREEESAPPTYQRPSPFGPATAPERPQEAPAAETPAVESAPQPEQPPVTPQKSPESVEEKAAEPDTTPSGGRPTLPGGRPSPFGPRS